MNKDFLRLRKELIDKVSYITRSPTSFVRLWTPVITCCYNVDYSHRDISKLMETT